MKTDNIYFAVASITTDKKYTKDSGLRLYGKIPLYDYCMYSKPLKPVLVLYKTDLYGGKTLIDLNTKQKYTFDVSSNIGKIFINPKTLQRFNMVAENVKPNLSKRKILKMGNKILNDLNKKMNEEE